MDSITDTQKKTQLEWGSLAVDALSLYSSEHHKTSKPYTSRCIAGGASILLMWIKLLLAIYT